MKHFKKTMMLRKQLVLCFVLVAFVPTFTLTLFFSSNNVSSITDNYTKSRQRVISQIISSVNNQYDRIYSLCGQIFINTGINQILQRPVQTANFPDKQYIDTINMLSYQYQYSPVSNYIQAMIIHGNNGTDIRFGKDSATVDFDKIVQSEWFKNGMQEHSFIWGGLTENYAEFSDCPTVIPLYMEFNGTSNSGFLGQIIILFNPSVFMDFYSSLTSYENDQVYLVKQNGEVLSTNHKTEENSDIDLTPQVTQIISDILSKKENSPADKQVQHYEININDVPNLVTYCRTSKEHVMIEILPLFEVSHQKAMLKTTTFVLIISSLVLSVVLSVFLSGSLTRPIETMLMQVKDISRGRFYNSDESVPKNEIGVLSASINQMQSDISMLMTENVNKEKEKRLLEMQMLQSQINPHFLYNTLNTIKLMAALQGASGIEKMLVSLNRILRFSLGSTSEVVPLREELSVLEDYIHIQKIHYKGKIRFEKNIEDSVLTSLYVPRFILQPIVENSIMHGFSSSNEQGKITISAHINDKLNIEVLDDGLGMTREQLLTLKEKLDSSVKQTGKGIGIVNVHNRIQLLYGKDYGIYVESEQNSYTKVTLVLKLIYGELEDENSNC